MRNNALQKWGISNPNQVLQNLSKASLMNLQKHVGKYGEKVESSEITLLLEKGEYPYEISEILEILTYRRFQMKLDMHAFVVKDFSDCKTDVYQITKEGTRTKQYDGIITREEAVQPIAEKEEYKVKVL